MSITTPITKPLWPHPSPPVVKPLPQAPGAWPGAGPQKPAVQPTGRHPLTGASIWEGGKPPLDPFPPFERHETVPNGRSPITGAPVYFRPGQVPPPGWEL
jgi:hypothetical protein